MSATTAKVILELARHFSDADFRGELKQKLLNQWCPSIDEILKAMEVQAK